MKRHLLLSAVLALAATAFAQTADVVYLEGDPKLRDGAGAMQGLDYGSRMKTGDSIITGRKDLVDLTQGEESTIRVRPDTVFTIREVETQGKKEQVLTTAVGAVTMRFRKLAGTEPRVGTTSTVAGIRGTELTIYAGPDGSSLFVVNSGLVAVEANGTTVDLAENEGVEVSAAGKPGEKFSVIGRELDFSAWATGKTEAFLQDPKAALGQIKTKLADFRAGLDEWTAKYGVAKVESAAAVATMNAIKDKAEQEKYRDETWRPLADQAGTAVLNYRYYALSAFSLRRYVLGPMYAQMKTRHLMADTDENRTFMEAYAAVLAEYKTVFNPYLNPTDY